MELTPGKIYYTMGEVAEMFDVNPSLLRFWERRFSILKPKKNKKGNRLFTPEDVKNLEIIYHLVKERGMTLAGAEKAMKEDAGDLGRDTEIVKRLQEIRSVLLEIREELKDETEGETVIPIVQEAENVQEPAAVQPVADEIPIPEIVEETVADEGEAQEDSEDTDIGEDPSDDGMEEDYPVEVFEEEDVREEFCEPLPFMAQNLFEVEPGPSEEADEPEWEALPGEDIPEPAEEENNNAVQQSLF